MTKRAVLLLCLLTIGFGILSYADEGMWLFNAFPKDKVQDEIGFAPDQAWLDHVRLSSARAAQRFVVLRLAGRPDLHQSPHCPGMYSRSLHQRQGLHEEWLLRAFAADEAKCPGMEFLVLQSIEDVTAKVNGAIKPDMSTSEAGKAQREEMASLEKECSSGDIRCDVVTLYSGAMYNLYKYKKYDDIRLVFAPEFSIAFFGGDPDNFEYPRYDLDISFFRAYENGQPAKTPIT